MRLFNILDSDNQLYGKDLIEHVKKETSGTFEKILVGLLECKKNETAMADPNQCRMDAERLYQAGEGRIGTNEAEFVNIFTTRSSAQLAGIAAQYQALSGKSLYQVIDSEFSGNAKKALNSILSANITSCLFSARCMWHIFPMETSSVSARYHVWLTSSLIVCKCRNTLPNKSMSAFSKPSIRSEPSLSSKPNTCAFRCAASRSRVPPPRRCTILAFSKTLRSARNSLV